MRCGCKMDFDCGCNKKEQSTMPSPCGCGGMGEPVFRWQGVVYPAIGITIGAMLLGWVASLEPFGADPGWDITSGK
jgi:hypothetical protein